MNWKCLIRNYYDKKLYKVWTVQNVKNVLIIMDNDKKRPEEGIQNVKLLILDKC